MVNRIDMPELRRLLSDAIISQHAVWTAIEDITLLTAVDFTDVEEWVREIAPLGCNGSRFAACGRAVRRRPRLRRPMRRRGVTFQISDQPCLRDTIVRHPSP